MLKSNVSQKKFKELSYKFFKSSNLQLSTIDYDALSLNL